MATPESSIGEGLDGLERFDALSQEIEKKFSQFHSLLETQRISLLERVRKMRDLYQEHQDMSQAIKELETIRRATNDVLKVNLIADDKDDITKKYDEKIANLKTKIAKLEPVSNFIFLENNREFFDCVKRIHLREINTEEYSKRREPLIMNGKSSDRDGITVNSRGISIDGTRKDVFIADYFHGLISVYSCEGEFIRNFGGDELGDPYGITLSDVFVFVTDLRDNKVLKFAKNGEFMGGSQKENFHFDSPSGLCFNGEYLYVCNSDHNGIVVLNLNLAFVDNFGKGKLKSPEDIEVFNNEIFVLTQPDNTIHTFSTEHNYLRSIHFTGQQNKISNAYFFTIDNNGNFIVSDRLANCLKVFSPSGEYVETLGEGYLFLPQGVAMDAQKRIFVVNRSNYSAFQMY